MVTFSNQTKNTVSFSQENKETEARWEDADYTWDKADFPWDGIETVFNEQTKNSVTLNNQIKL